MVLVDALGQGVCTVQFSWLEMPSRKP
jgi:hypothetical protein